MTRTRQLWHPLKNTTAFTLLIERSTELDWIVIFEVISSLVLGWAILLFLVQKVFLLCLGLSLALLLVSVAQSLSKSLVESCEWAVSLEDSLRVPFFPLGRDVSSCRGFDEVIFRWSYDACRQSDQVVFYFCWGYILRSGWWIFLILRFVKKWIKSFIFALVVFFHISDPKAAIVLDKVCCDWNIDGSDSVQNIDLFEFVTKIKGSESGAC